MTKFYDREKLLTIEEVKSLRESSGFTLEISEDEIYRAIDLYSQIKSQEEISLKKNAEAFTAKAVAEMQIMSRILFDPEFDGTPESYTRCLKKEKEYV